MTPAERADLVTAHYHFVRGWAQAYVRANGLYAVADEVTSDALLALVMLAGKYDPEGSPLSFRDYLSGRLRHRVIDLLRQRTGRSRSTWFGVRQEVRLPVSLDTYRNVDGETVSSGDYIEDPDASEAFLALELAETMREAAATLSARQLQIVRLYASGWTMAKIGARLGVTESRVSQVMSDVRARVRSSMAVSE